MIADNLFINDLVLSNIFNTIHWFCTTQCPIETSTQMQWTCKSVDVCEWNSYQMLIHIGMDTDCWNVPHGSLSQATYFHANLTSRNQKLKKIISVQPRLVWLIHPTHIQHVFTLQKSAVICLKIKKHTHEYLAKL